MYTVCILYHVTSGVVGALIDTVLGPSSLTFPTRSNDRSSSPTVRILVKFRISSFVVALLFAVDILHHAYLLCGLMF